MADIKSMVELYRILNDFRGKSISLINIWIFHLTIVAELPLTCQYLA